MVIAGARVILCQNGYGMVQVIFATEEGTANVTLAREAHTQQSLHVRLVHVHDYYDGIIIYTQHTYTYTH